MNRHDFDRLLQKYLAGDCNEEEARQVEMWSDNVLSNSKIRLDEAEKSRMKRRYWKRISSEVLGKEPLWRRLFFFPQGIAASVLVAGLLAFGIFSYYGQHRKEKMGDRGASSELTTNTQEGIITFQTEGKPQSLTLGDGTLITLGKGSSIRYPAKFDDHLREVYLEGEAFFKVKRDEKKPFLVYSGGLITRVLGTSFNVKSSVKSGKVEVEVVSGSVSVYENNKKQSLQDAVILTPNQKITFEPAKRVMHTELVEEPVFINPPERLSDFIFEDSPITEVVTRLSRHFEVKIQYDSSAFAGCVFNGDLNGLPLHNQLNLICRSINGNVELLGNEYFLRGEGCGDNGK